MFAYKSLHGDVKCVIQWNSQKINMQARAHTHTHTHTHTNKPHTNKPHTKSLLNKDRVGVNSAILPRVLLPHLQDVLQPF